MSGFQAVALGYAEVVAQEVEATLDPADERLVRVLLH